ncbi:MAG: rRNA maturation RNAse YbeY, partial [Lachnospiraceae bacterium]|nr:rRNA maturation RNAse YbeY [Lachnospiraceae bacterium]
MIFCVEDETGFCGEIDPDIDSFLSRIGAEALREEGIVEKSPFETELMIVGDEEIRAMNRENRGIDQATDVLSFPNIDLDRMTAEEAIRSQAADITDPETGHIL